MDKIKLSKDSKRILLSLYNGNYGNMVPDADLEVFVKSARTKGEGHIEMLSPRLTDEGRAYIAANPSLHNPSIWDDKKYIINTIISVVALAVAIIALFK